MNLTRNEIWDLIKTFNEWDLIQLNNTYCEMVNSEDYIYEMEALDDLFWGRKPLEILGTLSHDFNENNNYFRFNGYGLAESFDYFELSDFIDSYENLLECIEENWKEFEYLFRIEIMKLKDINKKGFLFNGVTITNPFLDESLRFEVNPLTYYKIKIIK